jgi:signal transduction histidine kinase
VRLSIQPNGRHGVMLAVEDDGYGFSEQFFTQLGRDSNQLVRQHIRDQSLGLGLMIVRQIVLAHGGMLTIRNRASGGASLLVTLPRAESDLLPSCA